MFEIRRGMSADCRRLAEQLVLNCCWTEMEHV